MTEAAHGSSAASSREPGPILTVEEAARYLRISRGLAFAAVRDGSIPSIRIGRRILIPRSQLDAMLDGGAPR
jgi:excisionase family DNA binding protein